MNNGGWGQAYFQGRTARFREGYHVDTSGQIKTIPNPELCKEMFRVIPFLNQQLGIYAILFR